MRNKVQFSCIKFWAHTLTHIDKFHCTHLMSVCIACEFCCLCVCLVRGCLLFDFNISRLQHFETTIFNFTPKRKQTKQNERILELEWVSDKEEFIFAHRHRYTCRDDVLSFAPLHKLITNLCKYFVWNRLHFLASFSYALYICISFSVRGRTHKISSFLSPKHRLKNRLPK